MFEPYFDKIYIRPHVQDGLLQRDTGQYEEVGTVIAIGKDVTFCDIGDTVYFASWLVSKGPKFEDQDCYVVPENSGAILGKIKNELSKKRMPRRASTRLSNSKNSSRRSN